MARASMPLVVENEIDDDEIIPSAPRRVAGRRALTDRVFRAFARGAGGVVLVLMGLVGAFLLYRALPSLRFAGWSFLTTQSFEPDGGRFGIGAVLPGTIFIALVAIVIATPLAMGTALYISEY